MNLGKLILKRKKAVSPVIATILLIALTVTAAAIVYFVVVPMLTKKASYTLAGGPTAVTGSGDTQVQFTIKNVGSAAGSFSAEDISLAFQTNGTGIAITVLDNVGAEILGNESITIGIQEEVTLRIELETGVFEPGTFYVINIAGTGIQAIEFDY